MIFEYIGRILFPRAQRWEQRRKVKMMTATFFAACIGAGCVALTIYRHNR